jgi:hypothetical protein
MHQLVHIVPPFGTPGRPTSTYTGWYILYHHLAYPASPLLHSPAGAYYTTIWHIWPASFYTHRLVHIVPAFGTSSWPTSTVWSLMRFHSSGLAFATSGWPTSTCTSWYILHHHLAHPAGPLLHASAGAYCTTIWHVRPAHFSWPWMESFLASQVWCWFCQTSQWCTLRQRSRSDILHGQIRTILFVCSIQW